MSTYGPSFNQALDGARLESQLDRVRSYMLRCNGFRTLNEIHEACGDPVASISAQLRHLRKPRFGGYKVDKRRVADSGLWEYKVS